MVRRERLERIKNRLEKFGAVPKWEAGNSDGLRKPCIFIGEKRSENSTHLQKRDEHREGSVGSLGHNAGRSGALRQDLTNAADLCADAL